MDMPMIILAMVAVAVLLLVGAIVADRMMMKRAERRHSLETGESAVAKKRDAADAVIDLLDRTGEMVRRTLDAAGEDRQGRS